MTPENNVVYYPEAQRQLELDWIDQNTPLFYAKASGYFNLVGRGAIIVDAVANRLGDGAFFTYFPKEQMEHIADEEVSKLVDKYDPEKEFIVLLLLPQNQTRAYRIDIPEEEEQLPGKSGPIEYVRT